MTHSRAWLVILAGALLAPLVTWLPMLAIHAPWIGLPAYHPNQGIDLWSTQALWFVVLGIIAVLVAQDDRWLSLAVCFAGFTIFWRGARLDPTHSVLFAAGALGLWAVRRAPHTSAPRVVAVLSAVGIFEAVYIVQQHVFQYDFLWMVWGGPRVPVVQPLGTLGTVDAATGYVAIVAPLMPLWALPLAIYAVWCGKSLGALSALAVGLVARAALGGGRRQPVSPAETGRDSTRPERLMRWALGLASLAPLAVIVYYKVWIGTATVAGRVAIQKFGLAHAATSSPLFGLGLGGWAQQIPLAQMQAKFLPSGEAFMQAHSDPIQWACETGAFGCVLLGLWLWSHRAMFKHATLGPSLAALGVSSLAFFPFHVVATALAGILLIGMAREPQPALGGA